MGLCCAVLGIAVHRVTTQKRAVEAIRSVYGRVYYDFHETGSNQLDPNRQSNVPRWIVHALGEDALHEVVGLDLDSRYVTDTTLRELRHLPAVRRLFIEGAAITNRGLGSVNALPNLRRLYIHNCSSVDDDSMACLAGIGTLEELEIGNAHVTDAGLRQLKGMSRLRRLSFDRTDVTEAGIADLQRALPNCQIDY
jgi:hypothetical protein